MPGTWAGADPCNTSHFPDAWVVALCVKRAEPPGLHVGPVLPGHHGGTTTLFSWGPTSPCSTGCRDGFSGLLILLSANTDSGLMEKERLSSFRPTGKDSEIGQIPVSRVFRYLHSNPFMGNSLPQSKPRRYLNSFNSPHVDNRNPKEDQGTGAPCSLLSSAATLTCVTLQDYICCVHTLPDQSHPHTLPDQSHPHPRMFYCLPFCYLMATAIREEAICKVAPLMGQLS